MSTDDTAVRSTTVLTNIPTSSAVAGSSLPATAVPIETSSTSAHRDSTIASAACTTVNGVTPRSRARPLMLVASSASMTASM
ncbi:Uncharacterised protein [Mycobacteroides abscessus subsp. abscessus]|nr:Uncharacterised protein [Mycobacteroides abscessus subsp. abscessus]